MATAWMVRCLQSSHKNSPSTFKYLSTWNKNLFQPTNHRFKIHKAHCRQIQTLKGADKQVQSVAASQAFSADDGEQVHELNKNNNSSQEVRTRHARPNFLPLDTSFTCSEEAYRSKTISELLRALLVFRLTSVGWIVKHNSKVLSVWYYYKCVASCDVLCRTICSPSIRYYIKHHVLTIIVGSQYNKKTHNNCCFDL